METAIRRDAGGLDDGVPLFDLRLVELRERRGRAKIGGRQVQAHSGDPLLHGRIGHGSIGGGVEPGDDVRRRAPRRPEALPCRKIQSGKASLLGGRHIRGRRPARFCHHRQRFDIARTRLSQRIGSKIARQIDLPAHQVRQRLRTAAIGYELVARPSRLLKRHAAEACQAGRAGG